MKHKYINSVADDNSEASIYLYGTIGDSADDKIDGDYFARELYYLDKSVDLVKMHINCLGGDVFKGMSIVSAMRSMTTPVWVYIDGVAASMGAVIATAGDKIHMQDYSMLMIHDPLYDGDKSASPKQVKVLAKVKESLIMILGKRGKTDEDIAKLMSEETWFSAAEALSHNLCDEILTDSGLEIQYPTPSDIVNQVNDQYFKKNRPMKITAQAAQILNVAIDATDEVILAAIINLHVQNQEITNAKTAVERELQALKDANKASLKVEIDALISAAILSGRIDNKAKSAYENFFEKDPEGAKLALESIPERKPVAGQVGVGASGDELLNLTWDEAFRSNKLETIKNKYPDHYQKLRAQQFPTQE